MSIAVVGWSVVTPLTAPESTLNKGTTLPRFSQAPEVSVDDLNSIATRRFQGMPPEPTPVQTTITQAPKITLPPQLKLRSTMIASTQGEIFSMAVFDVGPREIHCFVGEEVLEAKVLEIKKNEVKLLYRETEFTLTNN